MPVPISFVEQKNTSLELKTSVKNWERKIEIAEVAFKKAKTILRSVGDPVEDLQRPTAEAFYN